jgi:pSer/pThr/pTyr-binding forkhead associated (FHA) protein
MPASKGRITVGSPACQLSLTFVDGECVGRASVTLQNASASMGRGEDCDVLLDGETVSRVHCRLMRWGTIWVIQDQSRNGTFVNGQRIQEARLSDGDQIRVGKNIMHVQMSSENSTSPLTRSEAQRSGYDPDALPPRIVVKGPEDGVTQPFVENSITFGRQLESQVVLDAENISRSHARVFRQREHYFIEDLGSSNGTFLNDQRIKSARLREGDRIKIGAFRLTVSLRDRDCILFVRKNPT